MEKELNEIERSNERIRAELESLRSTGYVAEETPRSIVTEPQVSTTSTSGTSQAFGQRPPQTVYKMWGLEEQIQRDLQEQPSNMPLMTREYETTAPQSGAFMGGGGIGAQAEADVIVISSSSQTQIEEFTTIPSSPRQSPVKETRQIVGLRDYTQRTPGKRVINVIYDKDSMIDWGHDPGRFAAWLKTESGLIHGGNDLIRHICPSRFASGVVDGSEININEDLFANEFPDHFQFWLQYVAHRIPFEIVFIQGDWRSLERELKEFPASLVLCPTRPKFGSFLGRVIEEATPKVPVMYAS